MKNNGIGTKMIFTQSMKSTCTTIIWLVFLLSVGLDIKGVACPCMVMRDEEAMEVLLFRESSISTVAARTWILS